MTLEDLIVLSVEDGKQLECRIKKNLREVRYDSGGYDDELNHLAHKM